MEEHIQLVGMFKVQKKSFIISVIELIVAFSFFFPSFILVSNDQ